MGQLREKVSVFGIFLGLGQVKRFNDAWPSLATDVIDSKIFVISINKNKLCATQFRQRSCLRNAPFITVSLQHRCNNVRKKPHKRHAQSDARGAFKSNQSAQLATYCYLIIHLFTDNS